jgi:GAF domain
MELCEAVSGGISLYEPEPSPGVFRWHHLRGDLEKFTGATTPRHYSPCGITLDRRAPILVQRPERVYTWLQDANVSLPECLLVPLYVGADEPLGTLWIVSEAEGNFDGRHADALADLAGFAGLALRTAVSSIWQLGGPAAPVSWRRR